MDPLTHTLVGANLASTKLGKSRFAGAALVIGANLPDVDSILYFTGHSDLALGFRRGWTHGVLALVLLPLLLALVLRMFGGSFRPLLLVSTLAILTHPFLDWLNNYGMRWLMPFDGRWFYGDSVFIMDPWLWLILGAAFLAGRKRNWWTIVAFVLVTLMLAYIVAQRSPSYLVIVGVVAVIVFAAMMWKTQRSMALPGLIAASIYIAARLAIHYAAAIDVRHQIGGTVEQLMVAPHPIDPTRWDVVAQTGDVYRYGRYNLRGRELTLAEDRLPVAKPSPEYEAALRDPSIQGFRTWMRFPWYEVLRENGTTRVLIHDARYAVRRGRGAWGGVEVVVK